MSTIATYSQVDTAQISGTSAVLTLLLIALLIGRELGRASDQPTLRRWGAHATVVVVPVLFGFGLIVITTVASLL